MNNINCSMLVALAAVGTATAQGTITNDNVSYTIGTISPAQVDAVAANFTANQSDEFDVLTEHWWYYRVDSDPAQVPFDAQNLSQSYVGNRAHLRWSDVGGRGLFRADLVVDVKSTIPQTTIQSGVAVFRMAIENISADPLTLNLFEYCDFDVCGFVNTASGDPNRHLIEAASCDEFTEFYGASIDHFAVGPWSLDELGLRTGAIDLPDAVLPFTGDYTAAFQWRDRVLMPGEIAVYTSCLAHNDTSEPAAVAYYGPRLPEAPDPRAPTIESWLPRLGTTTDVRYIFSGSESAVSLLLGRDPAFVRIGPWTLLVDIWAVSSAHPPGTGAFGIPIPNNLDLCGRDFYFQCVGLDNTMTHGLTLTRGMEWIIGRY